MPHPTLSHATKVSLCLSWAAIATPAAIAQSPTCYRVTSTGQTVDLTALCKNERTKLEPIVATNLSLDVPEEEFLSSKVKATLTNRSDRPVQVGVVMLQISRSSTPVTTVPLFVNQVLSPGQSISASGIIDKADLRGEDPKQLSVSLQSLK
ncbi:MAG: hypothetical protein HC866_19415 [Leptolyngbyaceae cyanobacterium RU_5_1]|nr:hypothetical protein [Leptolyngbyaceae cyanobacterium RU_5_1]